MSEREQWICDQNNALRAVRDEIADVLPPELIVSMDELMLNGEPNEALLQLAWRIANNRINVSETVLRFIENAVGDPGDLPVDLTGRSGTPVSRRRRDHA